MNDVLVIGAGKRVKGAVLPALWCLRDRFRIAAVCSRKVVALPYGPGTLTTVDSLERVDFSTLSLIIVAITTEQVPRLLATLARKRSAELVLLLDTPVLLPGGLAAIRWFSAFKRVLVSEDNIALPPSLLARRLVDSGALGALRHIFFFHNGFKFHALAGLKMLAGSSRIRHIVDRKFGGIRQKTIQFENGVRATMYEPRDYVTGKFLLQCERGCIADYDHAVRPTHRIGYSLEGRLYRGLTLNGEPVPNSPLDLAYVENTRGLELFDGSAMNSMKLRGLMDLLDASLQVHSPFHYSAAAGLSDSLAVLAADRVGYALAPYLVELAIDAAQRRFSGHATK